MVSIFSGILLLWTSGVGYHRAAVREADCFGGHCSVNQGRGAGPRGAGHHVSACLPHAWCAFDYMAIDRALWVFIIIRHVRRAVEIKCSVANPPLVM